MDGEIAYEFPPFIRVYKDGRTERILISEFIPPSLDPSTGVSSKDIIIESQTGLSARLYLPKLNHDNPSKLPLVIYFHGGGFCIESAFSPVYHSYLNSLAAEANVVIVSVEYRLAPEHPLPAAYQDSWTAFQWVFSEKEEEWLSKYVDYSRVFMAGDSAGANIAHNMAIRAGTSSTQGFEIEGVVLVHPYFESFDFHPVGPDPGRFWRSICPSTIGLDDPFINPYKDSNLGKLGCKRMLVCVAEKDFLRQRGKLYYEMVGKSGWEGTVEFMESPGEPHVFHLFNPSAQNSKEMMNCVVSFLSASHPPDENEHLDPEEKGIIGISYQSQEGSGEGKVLDSSSGGNPKSKH